MYATTPPKRCPEWWIFTLFCCQKGCFLTIFPPRRGGGRGKSLKTWFWHQNVQFSIPGSFCPGGSVRWTPIHISYQRIWIRASGSLSLCLTYQGFDPTPLSYTIRREHIPPEGLCSTRSTFRGFCPRRFRQILRDIHAEKMGNAKQRTIKSNTENEFCIVRYVFNSS